jgi:hypothetical protein
VLGFLRQRRREAVPYWQVVNAVVQASYQATRWEVRVATTQVLRAVKVLTREHGILRYRRCFLAVLNTGEETIPLDRYYALPRRTATGRCSGDSTILTGAVKNVQNRP